MPPTIDEQSSRLTAADTAPATSSTPTKRWRFRAFIALAIVLVLAGAGFAATLVLGNRTATPGATPTPSVAPSVSSSERSKVSDKPLGSSELVVTTLKSDAGEITRLLVKALQIDGSLILQGDLSVSGNGSFSGNLTAANFSGNGSQLTNVNANLLGGQSRTYYENLVGGTAGTVSNLAANAALRNAANTFTANNTFNANVTVSGSTTLGATSISSLVLGSPLSAGQGGTGLTSIPVASVIYGQGGAFGVATPAGAGLCLISGASDVQWGSCSGSSGVTSLNGLTGALTIANASAAGSTITISDATTAAKGIASFNATNFSVTAGAVNTVQNIDVTATPTFAGLTLSAPLTVANGGTGATSLTANGVVLGNGAGALTTVTAGGAGLCLISNAGAPSFQACPGGGGVTSLNGLTGGLSIANASGSGVTVTINDASTSGKGIAQFSAINFTASSGSIDTIQNIHTTASPTFAAVNTNGITPSGALTVGATSQTLTLQGSNTTVTATNGANVAQLTFVAPTANVTYRLQTAAAGTYDVCTTAGNCVGVGGSVSTSGGSANVIPKYTASNTIGPSLLTDNGTLVTVGGDLAVTGTLALTNALAVGQGGTGSTSAAGARGNLGAAASGANSDITSLTGLTTALSIAQGGTGAITFTSNGVLIGNGTSAISAVGPGATNQCLMGNTGSAPSFQACPGGGAVTSVNSQTGAVTIANASGSAGTVTIDDASTSAKGIAQFNATNFSASSGTINTIQNINTGASPTFAGVNTNTITPSAALTVGATGQAFTIQGNGSSVFTSTASGNTTTVGFATPTANTTINFPASAAGTYTVCTTVGNCVGGGGGVTTSGGTTNAIPKFSGAQTLTDSIISDSGTVVTVAGGAVVQGSTGLTLGTASGNNGQIVFRNSTNANTFTLQSGATGSNLTFTLPVADGSAGDCLTTNSSGVLSFSPCLSGSGGGSGGVVSLDGLSGALSVANATGSGATITIDNASTSAKGIAQFNATNFQAASGTINTIQDIDTGASPVFSALSLTGAGGVTVGTSSQLGQLNLRDGSTAFSATFQPATLGANRTITVPNAAGTLAVSASGNIALSATGNITFTGLLPIANGGTNANNATTARSNLGAAASGANADITSTTALNTITPSSALTVGATSQSLLLQGSTTTVTATNGANLAQLTFVNPTANVTYRLQTAAAGTYDVCTTTGNCAGVGGSVTTAGGTINQLAKFSSSNGIVDSIISDNGTIATVNGGVTMGGNLLFNSGANRSISLAAASSGNHGDSLTLTAGAGTGTNRNGGDLVLQGGTNTGTGTAGIVKVLPQVNSIVAFTVQNASTVAAFSVDTVNTRIMLGTPSFGTGRAAFANSTTGFLAILQAPGITGSDKTITLPDASGTVAVSASGNIALSAAGDISFTGQLPVANGGTNANNATTARSNLGAAASGANADITSTTALNTITPGAALTVGATGQSFTLQGTNASTIVASNGSNTTTIGFTNPSANTTLNFPASAAGTYTICTSIGNCGGAGSVQLQGSSPGTPQTGHFNISGTGIASTSLLTPLVDTPSGTTTLDIGTTNATAGINLNQSTTILGGKSLVVAQGSSTTAFQVITSSGSSQLFTVDQSNSRVTVGSIGNCTGAGQGRFCVNQAVTTNGTTVIGQNNTITVTNTGSGTQYGQLINVTDTSSAVANTSHGLYIDGTATTNNSAIQNGITVAGRTQNAGNLLNLLAGGSSVFSVTNTGVATMSQNLTIQGSTPLALGTAGSNNGSITFNSSNAASNTILLQAPTNMGSTARTITLPDASGTLAVSASGNIALSAAGNITFTGTLGVTSGGTGAGTFTSNGVLYGNGTGAISVTAAGTTNQCLLGNTGSAPTWGTCPSSGGVTLQGSTPGTPDTGNFNVTGTGIAATALQTALIDTPSGTTTLNVGTTNATAGIALNQDTTVLGGKSLIVAQGSSATALHVKTAGGGDLFTVDQTNSRVYIGSTTGGCTGAGTGRFCLNQNVAINGSVIQQNNTMTIDNDATSAGTQYSSLINITDTSTAIANTNYGIYIDATGTTNNSATQNGIVVLGRTQNAGNLIDLRTGGSNVLTVSNTGAVTMQGSNALTLGVAGSANGGINFRSSNASSNAILLQAPTNMGSTARTITLPDASGTVAVAASGNIALSSAGNISFTGQLPVANGGSGAGTFTANGILYGNGTGAFGVTAAGTTNQCLLANTGSAPTWGTCSAAGSVSLQGSTPGTPQTGHFNISGTGIASTLLATTFDATSATTITIGGTASAITLADNVTVSDGRTITIGSSGGSGGNLTIYSPTGGGSGLNVNSQNTAGHTLSVQGMSGQTGTVMRARTNNGSTNVDTFQVLGEGNIQTDAAAIYMGGTSTEDYRMALRGQVSSGAGNVYGIQNQTEMLSSLGTATIYGLINLPTIDSASANIANVVGFGGRVDIEAGYSGTITEAAAVYALQPGALNGTKIANYAGLRAHMPSSNTNSNSGNTSGNINNYGVWVEGAGALAGSGGTLSNYAAYLNLSTGNNASTTNTGLRIDGNGGASATNYAINSTSTAQSAFSGRLTVNTNSATAFAVQDGSSNNVLLVDSASARVYVGPTAGNTTGTLLVFGNKTNAGDPTGVEGGMYYNSSTKSFRCYTSGTWRGCAGGVVFANTSVPGGNTVANTTTETNFTSNYSIPANDCQPGKVYRVTAYGLYGTHSSSPQLNIRLKFGSTTIGQTGDINRNTSQTNETWHVSYTITCITAGASGTIEGQGDVILDGASSNAEQYNGMGNNATVTIDTTAAQTLQLSADWDTANASNTIILRQLIVEAL
jgi:fibronectin-binding autotransporter adhesin